MKGSGGGAAAEKQKNLRSSASGRGAVWARQRVGGFFS
jgi:hypothetical protein